MARLTRRFVVLAAVVWATLISPGLAVGQPSDSEFLARLGDPNFRVRQEAMYALMNARGINIDRLAQMYERAETPEQRNRLLIVARHIHLQVVAQSAENFDQGRDQRPSGAIGIPRDAVPGDQLPHLRASAVRVIATLPGFPAHAGLRRDDLIRAVDGQALPRTNDPDLTFANFQQMLQVRPPGSSIRLTVYRDGGEIEVPIRLAHGAALSQIYQAGKGDGKGEIPQLADVWAFNWETVRHQRFPAPVSEDEPLQVDWP